MKPSADTQQDTNHTRFYRDRKNGIILGVCAGLSDYFGVRVGVIRLVAVISLIIFPIPAIVGYLVAGFALKEKPVTLYRDEEERLFWQSVRRAPSDTFARAKHKFLELEQRLRRLESYVTSSQFDLEREFNKVDK